MEADELSFVPLQAISNKKRKANGKVMSINPLPRRDRRRQKTGNWWEGMSSPEVVKPIGKRTEKKELSESGPLNFSLYFFFLIL